VSVTKESFVLFVILRVLVFKVFVLFWPRVDSALRMAGF